jgi:transposase
LITKPSRRGRAGPCADHAAGKIHAVVEYRLALTAGEAHDNRIKQCRRVATRYDKFAANYLAFIQLASIRLWLRVNESTP